jgi:hypothetical protein
MIDDVTACELAKAIYRPIAPGVFDCVIDTDDITCGIAHVQGSTVFAFAGSENAEDWARDFFAVPYCHPRLGTLHAGFWAGMGDAWVALRRHAQGSIAIVCHSLGCAHGAIFAGLCAQAGIAVEQLVMFAPPRVSYRSLRDIVTAHVIRITAYRNGKDPVPLVPLTIPLVEAWVEMAPLVSLNEAPADPGNPFGYHKIDLYLRGLRKNLIGQAGPTLEATT